MYGSKIRRALLLAGMFCISVTQPFEATERFFKMGKGGGLGDLAGLPIGSYPIWKFHKYDGLSLKPVPIGIEVGSGIPTPPPQLLNSMPDLGGLGGLGQGMGGAADPGAYGPPAPPPFYVYPPPPPYAPPQPYSSGYGPPPPYAPPQYPPPSYPQSYYPPPSYGSYGSSYDAPPYQSYNSPPPYDAPSSYDAGPQYQPPAGYDQPMYAGTSPDAMSMPQGEAPNPYGAPQSQLGSAPAGYKRRRYQVSPNERPKEMKALPEGLQITEQGHPSV